MAELRQLVRPKRYPRSAAYDPAWVLGLEMGPHPLWQLEDLLSEWAPPGGSRVLDVGAGMGATSVFVSREYGSSVVSVDLWVPAKERQGVLDAAQASAVVAVDADIRVADFEEGEFDAIVSVDAFEYFGTDVHFLPRLLSFLKPGGLIAMSTPALRDDPYVSGVPQYVSDVVGWEAAAWHAPEWWVRHWELTGMVDHVESRWQQGGRDDWLVWETVRQAQATSDEPSPVVEMLQADVEENIGFCLMTARKR